MKCGWLPVVALSISLAGCKGPQSSFSDREETSPIGSLTLALSSSSFEDWPRHLVAIRPSLAIECIHDISLMLLPLIESELPLDDRPRQVCSLAALVLDAAEAPTDTLDGLLLDLSTSYGLDAAGREHLTQRPPHIVVKALELVVRQGTLVSNGRNWAPSMIVSWISHDFAQAARVLHDDSPSLDVRTAFLAIARSRAAEPVRRD